LGIEVSKTNLACYKSILIPQQKSFIDPVPDVLSVKVTPWLAVWKLYIRRETSLAEFCVKLETFFVAEIVVGGTSIFRPQAAARTRYHKTFYFRNLRVIIISYARLD
jgi:hypothetical protein